MLCELSVRLFNTLSCFGLTLFIPTPFFCRFCNFCDNLAYTTWLISTEFACAIDYTSYKFLATGSAINTSLVGLACTIFLDDVLGMLVSACTGKSLWS